MQGLHLLHIGGGLLLGAGETILLRLHILADGLHLLLGLSLGLLQHLVPLVLGFLHQLVRHPLGGHQRLSHGFFRGTVLLHLFHQHLHFALQHRVFAVKGAVILGQYVQELVHLGHIVSAKGRLGKGALRNLLRSQHSNPPKILSVVPGTGQGRAI